MKTIRCINAKSYNLTEGREYVTLNDTDNDSRYMVDNDRGLARNYDASLFEDVVTTLTDEEIIASITPLEDNLVSIETREGETVNVSFLNGAILQRTNMSCGIFELTGINNISARMTEFVENNFTDETPEFKLRLAQLIFLTGFQSSTEEIPFASIVLSTNTNAPCFNVIDGVLSDRGGIVETMQNPNSGNEIRFWYITKDQITA
ncbi:hypothetical protein N356_gp025 [Cellulophaga phage phi14:2]|uniref:Uncharacterized protein n=1 Tax=Cellulophaga phage phi14:2 TaxID=1327990 RepID=S0A398_9CAUD|nr:hypothetical protein N356_gp025 [Cellulophaga phage phi14:2]AGO48917.1 hypothetical protein Phi14:2_gp039 [Cellulophaga phage phi14:2]